eukprot:5934855-Ditylum_brightwellii.AAC.1
MTIYKLAKDLPGQWNGSKAQELLKKDIKLERHKSMKPKSLWQLCPEYQEFDSKTFRKHIYQEMCALKETPYWIYKKKKKALQTAAAKNRSDEDDLDFFDDPVLQL